MGRKKMNIDNAEVVRLYKDGLCPEAIGNTFGVSRATVRRILKAKNIPPRKVLPKSNRAEDMWRMVDKGDSSGCWVWKGVTSNTGYGLFRISGARLFTYRLSYALKYGSIPNELDVCHKCDNPICCNPDHLFLGTRSDNMIDCIIKKRMPQTKLNPEKVREIRAIYSLGVSYKEIGQRFNVSDWTIRDIIKGNNWRHVV
jgi:transposase